MRGPIIVDVSGVVCRAYFAEESLSQREGRPFEPLAQLVSMVGSMTRLFDMELSTPAAAVLDPSGRTWRHDPSTGGSWDYKAKRNKKPPALSRLLGVAGRVFQAFGWPVVAALGFEADDVICTLAHKTSCSVIYTVDKDLLQCLGAREGLPYGSVPDLKDGARLWNPSKVDPDAAPGTPGSKGGWMGWEEVWSKFGVDVRREPATQIVELQALQGDAVDGIPGAKGIGAKVAKLLIAEFGTAEKAIQAAIEGPLPKHIPQHVATRRRLIEHVGDVRMSHRLARLVPNVPGVHCGFMGRRNDAELGRLMDRGLEPRTY